MDFDDQIHGTAAAPDPRTLLKNLVGAFLVLTLSIATVWLLLLPDLRNLLKPAMLTHNLSEWIAAIGSLLLMTFLIVFPLFLILQGFVYYRNGRDPDRQGF